MLFRLAYSNIARKKGRFTLTILSVLLGVSFVVGVFLLTNGLRVFFGGLSDEIAGDSDLIVRTEQDFGDRAQALPVPVELAGIIEGVENIRGVISSVFEPNLILLDDMGEVIDAGFGGNAPVLGINWDLSDLNSLKLAQGRIPENSNEFAIGANTAQLNNLNIGNVYEVILPSGPSSGRQSFTLVGTHNFADLTADSEEQALLIAFDNETAVEIFNEGRGYDQIEIFLDNPEDVRETQFLINQAVDNSGALAQAGGVQIEIVTTAEVADEFSDFFNTFLDIFRNVLLGFAFVILLVSTFVIFNTFSIILEQRVKELGLLRAIGSTGRQIQTLVLAEAGLIGVVATVLGLAGGIGVFYGLIAFIGLIGGDFPSLSLMFSTTTVIAAIFVGVVVTLLSALAPALRSRNIPPIAAIREGLSAAKATQVLRRPTLGKVLMGAGIAAAVPALFINWSGGLVLLILATVLLYVGGNRIGGWWGQSAVFSLGSALLILAVVLPIQAGETFTFYAFGTVLLFFGTNLLAPLFSSRTARALGTPFRGIYKMVGRLGSENAARNPKRTATTAAALMVGLALVTGTSVLVSSLSSTLNKQIENNLQADWIVCQEACQGDGLFSTTVAQGLQDLPEVDDTLALSFVPEGIRLIDTRQVRDVFGMDLNRFQKFLDLDIQELGNTSAGNGALIYDEHAKELGLQVGDTLPIRFSSGQVSELEIAGIYSNQQLVQGAEWIVNRNFLSENLNTARDVFIAVLAKDNFMPESVRESLEQRLQVLDPTLEVRSKKEYQDSQTEGINQTLLVANAFLGLAFLVAIFGIANSLALSIFERTREIGLMRAIGMRRTQVRRMIRVEGIIVALFGTVLGIVLGIIFGAVGVAVTPNDFISEFSINPTFIIIYLILGVVIGLLSALWPAYRASRLNILDAISYE